MTERKLLRFQEVVRQTGVNPRSLHRWIANGELVNFLTVYQMRSGLNYYRLGRPDPEDELVSPSSFKYKLKDEGGHWL